ncbi:hypothetical protein B4U79_16249 [Dinothrombium tinctorium]|uniref:Protein roadkill-like protein n=1 Tax=Dinothrombium tinctorium TaxID=1965070 RepID=A0A3S3PD45_9ACAR|nr:hypothetical protein B4U79_16477 [Dinothrombium tinctorium]RWS03861.1 hypothetical protein B4U79_09756 [Dinothrombium tinctorium]RWS06060.1 hypothetical protein B4U79_16249 [Dinothrombium tinctorium]
MENAASETITDIQIKTFVHLWKVRSFAHIQEHKKILRCEFSPPGSKDVWKLSLKLNTVKCGKEGIGFFLYLKSLEETGATQVRAMYDLCVLDLIGQRKYSRECSKPKGKIYKVSGGGCGFSFFKSKDDLMKPEILGSEGTLTILIELSVFGDIIESSTNNFWQIEQFAQGSLSADIRALLEAQHECDFMIESNDGMQFNIHKFILKARSNVFKAMLEHRTKEKIENKIKIGEFNSIVIKELINFMYKDVVDDLPNVAEQLLLAADKYNLVALKKLCAQYLFSRIDIENCGSLLVLSDMSNCWELKEKVLYFIKLNADKICSNDHFEKAVDKRPSLYKETCFAISTTKKLKTTVKSERTEHNYATTA